VFDIRARGSSVQREILGGLTTFMAMSYILFVQPVILGDAGMDPHAVFMATAISAAVACAIMGLLANYPIALAPGMGENAFFTYTLCHFAGFHWSEALALVALSGGVFLLLSVAGLRAYLINGIPNALKHGIAAGIGLFIALIGFKMGNLVTSDPATTITLQDMPGNAVAALTLLGLAVMVLLTGLRVPGAMLIGIIVTTVAAWGAGQIGWVSELSVDRVVGVPTGLGKTAGHVFAGFSGLWHKLADNWVHVITFTFVLLLMDMFDTVGTLVGVASRAGLMTDGRLPRANRALAADACGTLAGSMLGSSTVTSYIESITGVASGARTGLAALVTAACLIAVLPIPPAVLMIRHGIAPMGDPGARYFPMIAPALILVGAMMLRAVQQVKWDDITEALPAFLTMVVMPFAFSISAGIGAGFISYAAAKVLTGRAKECPVLVYVCAVLFVVRFLAI
jgi:AGZA family xanthine/uracil permease-like MFS transporter